VSTPDDSLQRFAFGPRGWGMRNEDGAIYAEVSAHLIRYAAVLVGPDEADDVVSNVMVRLLRRRSLSSLEDPRAYLFRSVLNESRGVLRSRRRRPPPSVEGSDTNPEPDWEVVEAVAALPARQRAAVFLRYWADLPVDEVARLMGARPGTVKRYLHIAHRSLKGRLS
jgi:RNA polymerase sigma factor (sigma-70 family)